MKKLIIIIVVLLAVAAGIVYFVTYSVNTLRSDDIKIYLNKIIVDGSDSLYSLNIKDYEVNSSLDGAKISGVTVMINQPVFEKMRANNTLPEIIFEGEFQDLYLDGVELLSLVQKNKDIVINNVRLEGANIKIYQYKKVKKDTSQEPIIRNLFDRIKKDINSINIKYIDIRGGKMSFDPAGKMDKIQPFWKFEDVSLSFKDFLVDSTSAADITRMLYAKKFTAMVKNFKGEMGNNMYRFSMSECDYDYNKQYLEISDLTLTPIVSHAQFFRSKRRAASEVTIKVPRLRVEGFQSLELIRDNIVKAKTVTINKGDISIYKDKSFGDPPDSKNGQYPNQVLYNLPIAIDIRQLIIKKTSLKYTEKGYNSKKEGILTFDNISGIMTNVTNVRELVRKNAWSELKAKATFQGRSPMTARLAFDLRDDKGRYEADATLKSLKAEQINPVIKNLGMSEAESFNLKSLNYRSKGDYNSATGSMEMIYNDLNINIYQKDAETKKVEEKKLISFLANLIKVRPDNVKDKDEVKAVNVYTERPYFRGFFALVWFNIFDSAIAITMKGKVPDILKRGRTLEGIPGGGVKSATVEEKKADEEKDVNKKKEEKKERREKKREEKKEKKEEAINKEKAEEVKKVE